MEVFESRVQPHYFHLFCKFFCCYCNGLKLKKQESECSEKYVYVWYGKLFPFFFNEKYDFNQLFWKFLSHININNSIVLIDSYVVCTKKAIIDILLVKFNKYIRCNHLHMSLANGYVEIIPINNMIRHEKPDIIFDTLNINLFQKNLHKREKNPAINYKKVCLVHYQPITPNITIETTIISFITEQLDMLLKRKRKKFLN